MRRPWVRLFGVVIALGLLYVVLVGLGLTGHKRGKQPTRVQVLNDFEDPSSDLQWATGGYVTVETATENTTHGKRSAHMTFLLPQQFFPTPTPGIEWKPAVKISHTTVTPLTAFDWSAWDTLNLDVFNPGEAPVSAVLTITDARGYKYDSTLLFLPKKVTNAAVTLSLVKKERLDLSSIDSINLQPDVMSAKDPVELYLDYLRLQGEPKAAAPRKK